MGAADKRKKQEIERKRKEQRKIFRRRLAIQLLSLKNP